MLNYGGQSFAVSMHLLDVSACVLELLNVFKQMVDGGGA